MKKERLQSVAFSEKDHARLSKLAHEMRISFSAFVRLACITFEKNYKMTEYNTSTIEPEDN